MVKAGLEMWTKSTAMRFAPAGVRVNAVAPTFMETNFYRQQGMNEAQFDALKKRVQNNIPMDRIGTEIDASKAIIFLTGEL